MLPCDLYSTELQLLSSLFFSTVTLKPVRGASQGGAGVAGGVRGGGGRGGGGRGGGGRGGGGGEVYSLDTQFVEKFSSFVKPLLKGELKGPLSGQGFLLISLTITQSEL